MMKVLCDTSFLMILVTKPIKLLENVEVYYGKINFIIPDMVIEELRTLASRSQYKISQLAQTALKFTGGFQIVKTNKSRYVDDILLDYAISHHCAVATIDKKLITRLRAENIMVFSLRNNKLLLIN